MVQTPLTNPYCKALGIGVPALERVAAQSRASTYSLMIVALLEQGGPMTLPQVAERFAQAGVAPADAALRALKRELAVDLDSVRGTSDGTAR